MNAKTRPTSIDIELDIQWDSTSTPHFAFKPKLPWVYPDGTLDFTTAAGDVRVRITLISKGGEKFASQPIGIVPLETFTPGTCPSPSTARHRVFRTEGKGVSADGRTFTIFNINTGNGQFFYALWFTRKPGRKHFAWDPRIINK